MLQQRHLAVVNLTSVRRHIRCATDMLSDNISVLVQHFNAVPLYNNLPRTDCMDGVSYTLLHFPNN